MHRFEIDNKITDIFYKEAGESKLPVIILNAFGDAGIKVWEECQDVYKRQVGYYVTLNSYNILDLAEGYGVFQMFVIIAVLVDVYKRQPRERAPSSWRRKTVTPRCVFPRERFVWCR